MAARNRAAVRRKQILELHLAHPNWNRDEIGKRVGVNGRHAQYLLKQALAQVAADELDLAKVALARSLRFHMAVMEAAWEIVTQPCGMCVGHPWVIDHETVVAHGANGVVYGQKPCSTCAGSGKAYEPHARLAAMDRHHRASTELSKLLDLYQPGRLEVEVNWRSELSTVPDAELGRMLDEYERGYTDAMEDGAVQTPNTEVA